MPIHALGRYWVLETAHSAYAFGLTPTTGALVHTHWGARLPDVGDYPPALDTQGYASFNGAGHLDCEEYPAHGGGLKYTEPCLKASFADGVRDLWLEFEYADVQGEQLVIALRDHRYKLQVDLVYEVFAEQDIIRRHAIIHNQGSEPVLLERHFSALWHLPYGDAYRLHHLTGRWNDEFEWRTDALTHGVKVLESRRLTTSHHHHPSFWLERGDADEDKGEVWFGTLAWSGNWKLCAEVTDFASTRLAIGINDWDSAWKLAPNERFITPHALAGYSAEGFGGASRRLHAYLRPRLPHPYMPRKVLFNSWEVSLFDVDVDSQKHYAELAAELGVELFVMDDGWFRGRHSDMAGLGDWTPDAHKFPHGLTPLIEHVKGLGMDFGLWVEPEMVNPDSDLYRQHPDWVLHYQGRPRTTARNQLILNLARQDVCDYVYAQMDALLSAHDIAFIKWDMNRNASEVGYGDLLPAPREAREIWVRYVQNLYAVWGKLAQKHPHVVWQSCSGGGGRADYGILAYADQIWVSDNTNPNRRLPMQEHFSHLFPPNIMEAWVTDMGEDYLPLEFRFHVSMIGALGIGANITRWTASERASAKRLIAQYKHMRHLIERGTLYRLRSARQHTESALMLVSPQQDEGVLFVYRTYAPQPNNPSALYLRGLNPEARYHIEGLGTKTGAGWMHTPLSLSLGNFESRLYPIRQV